MGTNIQSIANFYKDKDLSGLEIQTLIGKPPTLYYTIPQYSFNQLFPDNAPFQIFLLDTTAARYGHYVSTFITPTQIFYYDSYGLGGPDSYKQYTPYDQRYGPLLLNLLKSDPKKRPIVSNTVDMQSWKPNTSTCGRWSSLRIMYRHLDNEQFHSLFRNNSGAMSNKDILATILTLNALNDVPAYFESQK